MSNRFRLASLVAVLGMGAVVCYAHLAGRMTGGGSIFEGDLRITHGFELHCQTEAFNTGTDGTVIGPNNLEINWGPGNRFHLEELIFGVCTDEGDPTPPPHAVITTYDGAGFGRYNGVSGARASWRFTDFGEPGTNDQIVRLTIVDVNGNVVLNVTAPANLTFGNHQSHRATGSNAP